MRYEIPSKITEFKDTSCRVEKKVLRLDVAMANVLGMDAVKTAKQLIHVQLQQNTNHMS